MDQRQQGTSPWVWIGCGCGLALLLLVATLAGLAFFGVRWARSVEDSMRDPATREQRANEVLGTENLPEGYYPMVAVEIPFVMSMTILSDRPPDADGEVDDFGERGFFYFDFIRLGNQQELLDFFEGRTADPAVLRDNNINFDLDERVARGELDLERGSVRWVSHRGGLDVSGHAGGGLTTVMLIECPDDRRRRVAAWFGPDPAPEVAAEELDLAGTTADPETIGRFLSHFSFCG